MVYKNMILYLVIRIVLLLMVLFLISISYFMLDRSQLIFTFIVLVGILVIQIWELIWFLTKTNREISAFLFSLKHSDFQLSYPKVSKNKKKESLHQTFNEIIESFNKINIEKEIQLEFLRLVVEQVKVGILIINSHDEIILMNTFAEHLLELHKSKTWNQLGKRNPVFYKEINKLKEGGQTIIELGNNNLLSVQLSHSILLKQPHRIISFQNIKSEIEQKESDAWIRLIRILNHEIMNSVTPISSLTETILLILKDSDNQLDATQIEDIINCVKTIQKRSNGLFDFVTEYRKLTKIPSPKPELIKIRDLFEEIGRLMNPELEKHKIKLFYPDLNENLIIKIDFNLIEQVLINLIKNSIQALENQEIPTITLTANQNNYQTMISVCDNGCGIDPSIIKDIFVPFFTTKEKGSGIGLSLSRQIMRMHKGNLSVKSVKGEQSCFSLEFNNSDLNN